MRSQNFKNLITKAVAAAMAVTMVIPSNLSVQAAQETAEKNYEERLTPIMGWSSWNEFANNIDEQTFIENMDIMVDEGLVDLGYEYFNIDDGYQMGRDEKTGLVTHNPVKFPHGMKYIADEAHNRGMKAGMYTDLGTRTCASRANGEGDQYYHGKPGNGYGMNVGLLPEGINSSNYKNGDNPEKIEAHQRKDLEQYFIDWGYDFIKVDRCGNDEAGFSDWKDNGLYLQVGDIIEEIRNQEGRDIIYNVCAWTYPGDKIAGMNGYTSNVDSWRVGGDLWATWDNIMKTVNDYRSVTINSQHGQPGKTNDLDMMQVGRGMTYEEDKSHFSMWCMAGSSLMIGADLRKVTDETLGILKNEEMIAINQDEACLGATVAKTIKGSDFNDGDGNDVEIWSKDLGYAGSKTKAIAVLNRSNVERKVTVKWEELGFYGDVTARDVWEHKYISTGDTYTVTVPAHGTIVWKVEGDVLSDKTNTVVMEPTLLQQDDILTVNTRILRQEGGVAAKTLDVTVVDENGDEVVASAVAIADGKDVTATASLEVAADFVGKAVVKVLDAEGNDISGRTFEYMLPLVQDTGDGFIGRYTAQKKVKEGAILVDVRSPEEFKATGIEGAINIPYSEIVEKGESILSAKGATKDTDIIVYCFVGKRSAQARHSLQYLGYQNVYNLGGYEKWNTNPTVKFNNYQEMISNDTDIYITVTGVENDDVDIMYSIGEYSTIADAKPYTGPFTLAESKTQKTTVKAYLLFDDEVVYETSYEYVVFKGNYPDLSEIEEKVDITTLDILGSDDSGGDRNTDQKYSKGILKNKTYNGRTLTMAGKQFETGISAYAPSYVIYQVPEGMNRFVVAAGCDDEVGNQTFNIRYSIYAGTVSDTNGDGFIHEDRDSNGDGKITFPYDVNGDGDIKDEELKSGDGHNREGDEFVFDQQLDTTIRMGTGEYYVFDVRIPEGKNAIKLVIEQGNSQEHKNTNMHTEWGSGFFFYDDELEAAAYDMADTIADAKDVYTTGTGKYTDETWTVFEAAYKKAESEYNAGATTDRMNKLGEVLKEAQKALKEKPVQKPTPPTPPIQDPGNPPTPPVTLTKQEKDIVSKLGVTEEAAKEIKEVADTYKVDDDTLFITDKAVRAVKKNADIKGTDFLSMQAKVKKQDNKSATLSWSKVKGADGYLVYGAKADKKTKFKKLTDTKKTGYTNTGLTKGTSYKYVVVAYKNVSDEKVTIAASKTLYTITTGGKNGVAKKITFKNSKKSISLKVKKTVTLKTKETKKDKKIKNIVKVRYESSNPAIATVSKSGKVKGIKKGSCYIYAYAQNGVSARIKVKVKK